MRFARPLTGLSGRVGLPPFDIELLRADRSVGQERLIRAGVGPSVLGLLAQVAGLEAAG